MSETCTTHAQGSFRWVICALLFLATTSNYMDRQILGILAPTLHDEMGWSEIDYGHIVTAFQAAYALGLLASGWCIDRIGSRWGLIICVALWSIASAAHGFARNAWHFGCARCGLGLSEAGNFPASIKSVSEWFPKRERGLVIGIFNSGSNVGAIAAPLLVPYIASTWGWRMAFYLLGFLGFVWVALALVFFRPPPRAYFTAVRDDTLEPVCSYMSALRFRQTWAFALAKFLTDPVWWFYLYWTPKYLHSQFGLSLLAVGMPLVVIYLSADVGSIGGGWWSGRLMVRGMKASKARMRVMLYCALAVPLVITVAYSTSVWVAVALVSVAAAAHQGWSANLFASVSDGIPEGRVASVVGIGGAAGAIGGMLFAEVAGHCLEFTGSYLALFIVCGLAYLIAWVCMRALLTQQATE